MKIIYICDLRKLEELCASRICVMTETLQNLNHRLTQSFLKTESLMGNLRYNLAVLDRYEPI